MKTEIHNIECFDGAQEIRLDIFEMDSSESVDVYKQNARIFVSGGWRIEGEINGTPRGTRFFPRNMLGSTYYGEESFDCALEFLKAARNEGFLPKFTG